MLNNMADDSAMRSQDCQDFLNQIARKYFRSVTARAKQKLNSEQFEV